jgi:hypothetical protein
LNPFLVEICPGSSLAEIDLKLNGKTEWVCPRLNFLVTDNFTVKVPHAQGHREMCKDAGLSEYECFGTGDIDWRNQQRPSVRFRGNGSMYDRENDPSEMAERREQIRDAITDWLAPLFGGNRR